LLEPAANLTVINLILPVLCNSLQPDDTNHVAMFAFTHNVWPGHRVACLNKFNMTLQSRVSLVIQDIHLLASIAKQVSLKKTWKFEDSMPLIISACSHWIAQKLLAKATKSCFASRCTCTLPDDCASASARADRMSWAAYLTVPTGKTYRVRQLHQGESCSTV